MIQTIVALILAFLAHLHLSLLPHIEVHCEPAGFGVEICYGEIT